MAGSMVVHSMVLEKELRIFHLDSQAAEREKTNEDI